MTTICECRSLKILAESIDRYQEGQIVELIRIIGAAGIQYGSEIEIPNSIQSYSLLSQLFYALRRASEETLTADVDYCISLANAISRMFERARSKGEIPMGLAASCIPHNDKLLENVVYTFSESSELPVATRDLITESLDKARRFGSFPGILSQGVGSCILLQKIGKQDYSSSYTVTPLPGTLYFDYLEDELIIGETLIHEAAHSWLNLSIAATRISFDTKQQFYSPWKRSLRPIFGFIHAVFAFSNVVIYLSNSLESLRSDETRYSINAIDYHVQNLIDSKESLNECLAVIPDRNLAEFIKEIFENALERSSHLCGQYSTHGCSTKS